VCIIPGAITIKTKTNGLKILLNILLISDNFGVKLLSGGMGRKNNCNEE